MIWILYCAFAIVTMFLWNVIHEMSHVLAAKMLGHIKSWVIKPYPHIYKKHFRFAGAYWKWNENPPSETKRGIISLAPRAMDVVAIELLIVAAFLSGTLQILLLIFCSGGIIDLFVGSIGYSENSDLKQAAKRLKTDPWKLSVVGFVFCFWGALGVLAFFIN